MINFEPGQIPTGYRQTTFGNLRCGDIFYNAPSFGRNFETDRTYIKVTLGSYRLSPNWEQYLCVILETGQVFHGIRNDSVFIVRNEVERFIDFKKEGSNETQRSC